MGKGGADLQVVKERLGHTSITTTEKDLHPLPDEDDTARRGRESDTLYSARRAPHTGVDLLTGERKDRLAGLFANDRHVEVKATWGICQRMITAYRDEDPHRGRERMVQLIESICHGAPKACRAR